MKFHRTHHAQQYYVYLKIKFGLNVPLIYVASGILKLEGACSKTHLRLHNSIYYYYIYLLSHYSVYSNYINYLTYLYYVLSLYFIYFHNNRFYFPNVGFILIHPVNFPCGRKLECPEKTHDFRQSVDLLFHMSLISEVLSQRGSNLRLRG